jgi:glycosyltransferase involved in cell wall biosynthesis
MRTYLIGEGLAADRIEVVDAAIGIPPTGPKKGRASAEPHIVCVGRAVYAKGIQYLIRAVTLIDRRFRVTVVGDGWYLESLRSLAADLGLGDRITFPGILQGVELRRLLQTATVAVVPSIWPEPAGLVVPEMRSLGLPVVVTDAGGLKEWANRYSDIFIADPADAASLAAAIRKAAETQVTLPAATGWPRPQNLVALLERLQAEHSTRERRAADVAAMAPAPPAMSAGSTLTPW